MWVIFIHPPPNPLPRGERGILLEAPERRLALPSLDGRGLRGG